MKSCVLAVVMLSAALAFGEGEEVLRHWTGAVSGAWTEPGNWSENAVPGTGETAVFDRASDNTTIDVASMTAVGKILVTGADTPSYTFGTATSQKFVLDQKGVIEIDASVTTDQRFTASLYYDCASQVQSSISCTHNSSATLYLGMYKGPVTGVSGWLGAWAIYHYGTGIVKKSGYDPTSGGGTTVRMCKTGGYLEYTESSGFYQIYSDGTGTKQHIIIDKGCTLESSNPSTVIAPVANSDEIWFDGEGTLYFTDNGGLNVDQRAYFGGSSASGIVTVDCKFQRRAGNMTTIGFWCPTAVNFNHVNEITTGIINYHSGASGAKLTVVSFGSVATKGALGTGQATIQWDATSSLIYTGAGDALYNPLNVKTATAKLYNNGTGTERIESEVSGTGTLALYSNTGKPFALATSVPCTLNVAAGVPYSFVKKAGEASASYTVANLTFNANADVTIEDGVTVTVAAYTRSSDGVKVNVNTTGGKLYLTGLASGPTPSWLAVNRQPGVIGEGGEVISLDAATADVSIDAHGGVIPNAAGIVSIDTAAGAGSVVSLAQAAVTNWVLRQAQNVQPAIVELKDGENLVATNIHVSTGAQPLKIQTAEGASATLADTTIMGGRVELGGTLNVGSVKLGNAGVLAITDGLITGGIFLNCPSESDKGFNKAFYMTGGVVTNNVNGNRVGSSHGYVYSEISGGAFDIKGSAYYGAEGLAMLAITGGTTTLDSGSFQMQAMKGAFAACYQTGGIFQQTGNGNDLYLSGGGYANGSAVWTVEGTDALTRIRSKTDSRNFVVSTGMSSTTDTPAQGILNINDGGTVHCGLIVAQKNHAATSKALLNFNGGIFYNNYSYGRVFGEPGGEYFDPIDRVTVFKKGMTIKTTVQCSTKVPIDKPTGKGVSAIAWTDTTTTFIGAPLVQIVGDGIGASAVALYDSATRKVSGIRVTSPGIDYTTATAKVLYGSKLVGGGETIAEIACELADNDTTGGFTMTGGGTFTFFVTNTYEGATVVDNGTLVLGADDVISAQSGLVLGSKGTLNMSNKSQTFSDITCNGGQISNGRATITGLVADFAAAKTGSVKRVDIALPFDFAPGAVFSLKNYDITMPDVKDKRYVLADFVNGVPQDVDFTQLQAPEGWAFKFVGNKLKLSYQTGLSIIVR